MEFVHVELKRETWIKPEMNVRCEEDAIMAVKKLIQNLDRELVICVHIATSGRVINASICAMGTMDQAVISPSEVMRTAILSGAHGILMLHNHPSGCLKDNNTKMLKSRRNKKYMSGNNIYNSYVSENSLAGRYVQTILDYIESNNVSIGEIEICAIVAECAAQLLLRDTIFSFSGNCLQAYLDGCLDMNGYEFLIDDLVYDKDSVLKFIHKHPTLLK